jgi:hypothetical protein
MTTQDREKILSLYSHGRLSGRPDWMRQAWEAADDDPALEMLLLELSEAHAETEEATLTVVAPAPLAGLFAEAKKIGLNLQQWATELRLDVPTLRQIDLRLIKPATIPRSLVARIAADLSRGVGEIAAYLSQPATLAAGAEYKSRTAPKAAPQQPFEKAIKASIHLSTDDKAYWLSQTPDVGGDGS